METQQKSSVTTVTAGTWVTSDGSSWHTRKIREEERRNSIKGSDISLGHSDTNKVLFILVRTKESYYEMTR